MTADLLALLDQLDATGDDAVSVLDKASEVPKLTAALRAVLDRHHPWYEIGRVRHDNAVTVSCADFGGCTGTAEFECPDNGDGDGHEVLACYECRCVVDYDIDGYLLWPCPTVQDVTAALTPEPVQP